MHNWNQLQPAPYNGMYQFPSVTTRSANRKTRRHELHHLHGEHGAWRPDWDYNQPMLPPGKYVVEMIVPPGI